MLTKKFGQVTAVDGLSLNIEAGEIYGFLGLNGAGKTTTVRMLLGMIRPTSGSVKLFGRDISSSGQIWSRVGYLVDVPSAYPDLTVRENLEIARRLYHVRDAGAVNRIMDKLDITAYAGRRARSLSHGNYQRLGLARALLHDPELILLDEPANGLDPAGIVEIRELLRDLARERGTTVLMSSHILDEVARLATRIGIIHKGHLIEEIDADRLERQLQPKLVVDTLDNRAARLVLAGAGFELDTGMNGNLELHDDRAVSHPEDIAALLVSSGTKLTMLQVKPEDLEAHFMRIIGGGGIRS